MKTLELILIRKIKSEASIIGNLGLVGTDALTCLDNPFFCNTLEPLNYIPSGIYNVELTYSEHFKKDLPILLDVPERQGIRIHVGNSAKDTTGCILLGLNDKPDLVSKSKKYVEELINIMKQYDKTSIIIEDQIVEVVKGNSE
ncbi:hypothetical protein AGMMS49592_0400 [Endomicrobiia bacterium]|nr:hypothetical protein AGMMS49592_0400 [Endomicrobiia bacterium]